MASRLVLLYDGRCRFCTAGARRIDRLARPGSVELLDFQAPGVLSSFPQVTYEECMRAIQLVALDGRVARGLEAIVRVLMTRPALGLPARLYFVPGLRQLGDALYLFVAANRYRLFGRTAPKQACADDACAVHLGNSPTGRSEDG